MNSTPDWFEPSLDTQQAQPNPNQPITEHSADDLAHDWSAATDDFAEAEAWAAVRPRPWYRKLGPLFVALFVAGLIGTGALLPWGTLIDRLDNVQGPVAIGELADEAVAESPFGWLVEDVRVRDIIPSRVAGFVHGSPGDGIITIDLNGWDPQDLRSTISHEIGHLLDFAAYGTSPIRRNGLESEVWAECAAVDAGFRRVDSSRASQTYRCTPDELEQYRFAVSMLGEVCAPWSGICRPVSPIRAD